MAAANQRAAKKISTQLEIARYRYFYLLDNLRVKVLPAIVRVT
jgi:hypothetical protein